MRRITIRLLRPFEVTIDGAPVTTFEYARVHALVAYLAVEQDQVGDDDLHDGAQLAAVVLSVMGPQAAFHVHAAALVDVLGADFAQLAPRRAAMPFRLGLAVLAGRVAVVGGDVERGERGPVVEIADFRLMSEVADELHLVHVSHGRWLLHGR